MIRYRWGDEDRRLGPFIWGPYDHGFYIGIKSKDEEEDEGSFSVFRLSAFGWSWLALLPAIIKPYREKVYPGTAWDAATVARLGRNWYWQSEEREFSFSWNEKYVSVHYGRSTHDSRTDKQWGWFPPFQQWRFVRHSYYGLEGEHLSDIPRRKRGGTVEDSVAALNAEDKIKDTIPSRSFNFIDFDGEAMIATTKIEEREWRFGEGWFKWLSIFRKPKIRRDLDIWFSGETGKRKGSWKGGTMGHSITMLPFELHESAFKRYCAEHDMKFVGPA